MYTSIEDVKLIGIASHNAREPITQIPDAPKSLIEYGVVLAREFIVSDEVASSILSDRPASFNFDEVSPGVYSRTTTLDEINGIILTPKENSREKNSRVQGNINLTLYVSRVTGDISQEESRMRLPPNVTALPVVGIGGISFDEDDTSSLVIHVDAPSRLTGAIQAAVDNLSQVFSECIIE